jgi:hypothetical protein
MSFCGNRIDFRQLANAANNVTNLEQWMKEQKTAATQLNSNSNDGRSKCNNFRHVP